MISTDCCAQRGCLDQTHHGVAGGNAEFSGENIAHRTSSTTLRLTAPGHERARTTTSVTALRHTGATTPAAFDATRDTALALVTQQQQQPPRVSLEPPQRDKRGGEQEGRRSGVAYSSRQPGNASTLLAPKGRPRGARVTSSARTRQATSQEC